ncbi:hypothetical protein [Aquiflexum gelatinilyticum]|uniref:hypothetical protein n=1 Tax=Aquiflexum gelatinilyticum TaxID=2961943 RepID=UPI0021678860|nr:hypothetical protein [Aquiflexum gelatinilyticum]MCS4434841.1 hypothetical protein [Aquiflexum gelatinilyticum]
MIRVFILFFALGLALSCKPKTEYDLVKERELTSGKIEEDLFLDIRFGMGRKEFYGTCWEHNKNGILVNGDHYLQIQYLPKVSSGKSVVMNFYPEFEEDKLFFMPMEFGYTQWFPGNEEFTNEKLIVDVVDLLESWYGDGFFEVSDKDKKISAMVKIDGNRLIRVFKKNINTIRVEILDLRVKDITEMTKKVEDAS